MMKKIKIWFANLLGRMGFGERVLFEGRTYPPKPRTHYEVELYYGSSSDKVDTNYVSILSHDDVEIVIGITSGGYHWIVTVGSDAFPTLPNQNRYMVTGVVGVLNPKHQSIISGSITPYVSFSLEIDPKGKEVRLITLAEENSVVRTGVYRRF